MPIRTLEQCKKDALKYKYKKEWKTNSSAVYAFAYKRKWLDMCGQHFKRPSVHNKIWTKENAFKKL
jgi:hypothetical protein